MLQKVDLVKDVGRFSTLKHKAPQFSKLTLIFARNAFGKSTICSILNSLSTNNPTLIEARRKLGSATSQVVINHAALGSLSYDARKWNKQVQSIFVFDQDYVENNVHVGGSVTRSNKRKLLPVILGAAGISITKEIAELDQKIRDQSMLITNAEKSIRAAYPSVADVGVFCKTAVPENIDEQIADAKRRAQLYQRSAEVKSKAAPKSLEVPALDMVQSVLAKTLDDLAEDANIKVERHITEHALQPSGQRWIKYGVDRMPDNHCPFCAQDTSSVEIVQIFKKFFGAEYATLISDVEACKNIVDNIAASDCAALMLALSVNGELINFWQNVCKVEAVPTIADEVKQALASGFKKLAEALSQKAQKPLHNINLDETFVTLRGCYNSIEAYNKAINDLGHLIEKAKLEANPSALVTANQAASKLQALKDRDTGAMKDVCEKFLRDAAIKLSLEKEKKVLQERLKSHSIQCTTEKEDSINALLRNFGANFRVCGTKSNFVGGEPNTEFSISIGGQSVPAGEANTERPSFKTLLSAGDKFSLALAFFITQVRAEQNIAEAIIVFDDPFNSQDMNRQWETARQIRQLSRDAAQVIVLSHDPRFLNLIESNADRGSCSEFQICLDSPTESKIASWKSEDEIKSLFVKQYDRIRYYAQHGMCLQNFTEESLAKDIKPFIEDYIKNRFPGRFETRDMMQQMIEGIQNTGSNDPLWASISDISALNEFARVYGHGGAPPPDPIELRAQCERVLDIVGRY
ncbi:MAG TPA: AAA family ATPase [Azospirillaceae bacterium]|nr:AAA family ATPase [Azospirillaceae bacterium]